MGIRQVRKDAQRVIKTETLPNGDLRTAARLIEARVGAKRGNGILTEGDLEQAAKDLRVRPGARHQSTWDKLLGEPTNAFENLHPWQEELIQQNLPALSIHLQERSECGRTSFFANAFFVKAVRDPKLRDCARIIANSGAINTSSAELNNDGQVNQSDLAKILRRMREEKPVAIPDGMTPERFAEVFTPENVRAIERFMMSGEEDLITLRNVSIESEKFSHAFPIMDFPLPDPDTDLDPKKALELHDKLKQLDRRFANSGFDRVYVRGPENLLYVLPHVGRLKATFGMRMQPGYEGKGWKDTGQVLAVQNEKNSAYEATVAMWGNLAEGVSKGAEKLWSSDPGMQSIWNAPAAQEGAGAKGFSFSEKLMSSPVTSTGAVATTMLVGAGVFVDPSTVGKIAAVGGALIQIASGVSAARNQSRAEHTLNTFYHAAGVSPNGDA